MTMFKQTTAFDTELIKPGCLITMKTNNGALFASGVVIEALPLVLKAMIYVMGPGGPDNTVGFDLDSILETMTPYDLTIEQVVNGQVIVTVISPETLEMIGS